MRVVPRPLSFVLCPSYFEVIVPQEVYQHTFDNGLTLLAERMEHVRSAALNFLVPAGCAYDPPPHRGIASVLSELITRGAGERDSRELSLALDNLGLDRDESGRHLAHALLGRDAGPQPAAALDIYADIIRRPHLPEDEIDPVKALALQDLQGLEDEPRHKVMIELRRLHYPPPLGQDRRGTEEGIAASTPKVRAQALSAAVHAARHHRVGRRQHRVDAAARPGRPAVRRLEGRRSARPDPGPNRHSARPSAKRTRRRRRSASPTPACRSATPITTRPSARSTSSAAA